MNSLPVAPIDRLMRKSGAERVSDDAAREMSSYLAEVLADVTKQAAKLAQHAGRKTVTREDVRLAVNE